MSYKQDCKTFIIFKRKVFEPNFCSSFLSNRYSFTEKRFYQTLQVNVIIKIDQLVTKQLSSLSSRHATINIFRFSSLKTKRDFVSFQFVSQLHLIIYALFFPIFIYEVNRLDMNEFAFKISGLQCKILISFIFFL